MSRQCAVCGAELERPDGTNGRPRVTCSEKCRRRHRTRLEKIRYRQRVTP